MFLDSVMLIRVTLVHCSWISPVYQGVLLLGAISVVANLLLLILKEQASPGRYGHSCTHLFGRPLEGSLNDKFDFRLF